MYTFKWRKVRRKWRWSLTHRNKHIVLSSTQGYSRKKDAVRSLRRAAAWVEDWL